MLNAAFCYEDGKGGMKAVTVECLSLLLRLDGYSQLADEIEAIVAQSNDMMEKAIERHMHFSKPERSSTAPQE